MNWTFLLGALCGAAVIKLVDWMFDKYERDHPEDK